MSRKSKTISRLVCALAVIAYLTICGVRKYEMALLRSTFSSAEKLVLTGSFIDRGNRYPAVSNVLTNASSIAKLSDFLFSKAHMFRLWRYDPEGPVYGTSLAYEVVAYSNETQVAEVSALSGIEIVFNRKYVCRTGADLNSPVFEILRHDGGLPQSK